MFDHRPFSVFLSLPLSLRPRSQILPLFSLCSPWFPFSNSLILSSVLFRVLELVGHFKIYTFAIFTLCAWISLLSNLERISCFSNSIVYYHHYYSHYNYHHDRLSTRLQPNALWVSGTGKRDGSPHTGRDQTQNRIRLKCNWNWSLGFVIFI